MNTGIKIKILMKEKQFGNLSSLLILKHLAYLSIVTGWHHVIDHRRSCQLSNHISIRSSSHRSMDRFLGKCEATPGYGILCRSRRIIFNKGRAGKTLNLLKESLTKKIYFRGQRWAIRGHWEKKRGHL